MRGRRLGKKARGGGGTPPRWFAEDGGLRTDPLRSEQFCAIKTLYTMNVYDSNAETEGRKKGAKHQFCALLATLGRA